MYRGMKYYDGAYFVIAQSAVYSMCEVANGEIPMRIDGTGRNRVSFDHPFFHTDGTSKAKKDIDQSFL